MNISIIAVSWKAAVIRVISDMKKERSQSELTTAFDLI